LIVDDEALAWRRVARYARQFSQELLIEEAESGIEAVEMIQSFRPDIIFLDVEMPGLNGFEVLQQFAERPFHVIFQTAYDQFALTFDFQLRLLVLLNQFLQPVGFSLVAEGIVGLQLLREMPI
jgi:CheY-like chemotaxis protein